MPDWITCGPHHWRTTRPSSWKTKDNHSGVGTRNWFLRGTCGLKVWCHLFPEGKVSERSSLAPPASVNASWKDKRWCCGTNITSGLCFLSFSQLRHSRQVTSSLQSAYWFIVAVPAPPWKPPASPFLWHLLFHDVFHWGLDKTMHIQLKADCKCNSKLTEKKTSKHSEAEKHIKP